tara:strand:+ start:37 stop:465 length:429 start_codon:yes stop_codon:yes gene_type:complete
MFHFVISLLFPLIIFSQQISDDICGTWLEEKKESHIEIYKINDKYYGKIVWLANPLNDDRSIKLDKKNPDPGLKNRNILGLDIIKNLEFIESNNWSNGQIYDARTGKTYKLNAKLKSKDILLLRGFLGFSLIGKTTNWSRVK